MQKLSRRQISNLKQIKCETFSNLEEALKILKQVANANFIETFELHVNLNINPKYTNQRLKKTLVLPHGTGKSPRIAVLTTEENFKKASMEGVDIIGNDDLIMEITKNNINFDVLIATPNVMPKLAKLGRILGPKGLMPSPNSGTVTSTLQSTIKEFKNGKIEYKTDKNGIIHTSFGKSNFTIKQLIENLTVLYLSIEQNKPVSIKGKYFKSLYICSSMSPSIKLELDSFSSVK